MGSKYDATNEFIIFSSRFHFPAIPGNSLTAVNSCITIVSYLYYKWRGIQGRKNEEPDT